MEKEEKKCRGCGETKLLSRVWSSENISWGNKKKPGDENRIWMGREIGWVNINPGIEKI